MKRIIKNIPIYGYSCDICKKKIERTCICYTIKDKELRILNVQTNLAVEALQESDAQYCFECAYKKIIQ